MNRYRPIRESETMAVALFDHPEGLVHQDPEEEIADEYSISFVEHSGFRIQLDKKRWQFQLGDVFLTFPGMVYRCLHSDSIPTDRCLAVRYVNPEDSEDFAALARVARQTPRLATSNLCAISGWQWSAHYLSQLWPPRPAPPRYWMQSARNLGLRDNCSANVSSPGTRSASMPHRNLCSSAMKTITLWALWPDL